MIFNKKLESNSRSNRFCPRHQSFTFRLPSFALIKKTRISSSGGRGRISRPKLNKRGGLNEPKNTADDAKGWVEEAENFYVAAGKRIALAEFTNPQGAFAKDELYIFVLGSKGPHLARPDQIQSA